MKLSIISEGGAMRGAYSVGVLKALSEHYGLKKIDFAGGSSAGIVNIAFYVTGNIKGIEKVWKEDVTTKEFLDFNRYRENKLMMNLDYIMEKCQEKGLSDEAIRKSQTELIIPVTNVNTGKADFYSTKSYQENLIELIKASMDMPFISDKNIEINGNVSIDGGITAPVPFDYETFNDSKKIVIMTKTPRQVGKSRMIDIVSRELAHLFGIMPKALYGALKKKEHIYKDAYKKIIEKAGPELVLVQPTEKLSRLDNTPRNINNTINQGYNDAVNNEALKYVMCVTNAHRPDLFR